MLDITINHIIVHELIKKQHKDIDVSNMRKTVLKPELPTVVKLLEDIVSVYGKKQNRSHYGIFSPGNTGNAFPKAYDAYVKFNNAPEAEFIALTVATMKRLESSANSEKASTGGYIVFADYISANERFLLIAMIKQTSGIRLTEKLEPEELTQLDLTKLHQAAKINFGKYSDFQKADDEARKELNFLSFISPVANKSAAGYFITALGCSAGSTSRQATESVIKEARKFFRNNADLKANTDSFMSDLYEYLNSRRGGSVTLSEIGAVARKHMPVALGDKQEELEEALLNHLNSEECGVPTEFPPDQKSVHKMTHLKVQGDKWDMEFQKDALGDTDAADVYFDRKNGKLIISSLPDTVKEVIEEVLTGRKEDQGK